MTAPVAAPLVPRGLIPGVVILLVGGVFLADSLGMLDAHTGWAMWPVGVIVGGIIVRLQPGVANRVAGIILILAGVWLLLNEVGVWTYSFWKTWPALLILLGAWMRYRTWHLRQLAGGAAGYDLPVTAAEHLGAFVFLSRISRSTAGQHLLSGEFSAIAGDCAVDISNATPGAEPLVIDVLALAGRITIAVPAHWSVTLRIVPLAGRTSDTRGPTGAMSAASAGMPTLVVQGTAILAVVEIVAATAASMPATAA